jgi:excisionase family DNA binding protein
MENDVEKGYVTVREAARYLGLSTSAVRRLIREGELPAYHLSGKQTGAVRLARAELATWAEGQRMPSSAGSAPPSQGDGQ